MTAFEQIMITMSYNVEIQNQDLGEHRYTKVNINRVTIIALFRITLEYIGKKIEKVAICSILFQKSSNTSLELKCETIIKSMNNFFTIFC